MQFKQCVFTFTFNLSSSWVTSDNKLLIAKISQTCNTFFYIFNKMIRKIQSCIS